MSDFYIVRADGVELAVRLTPSASRDDVEGLVTDAAGAVRLKARVRAVPEKNKANRALEAMLAKRLKIAKSNIRVIAGDTNRNKTVRIDGDPDQLTILLAALAQ